ncbi:MAG: hypothetical protein KBS53_05635, partial [Bacteroidales bacterium]|nr:hypothetical protein [Candidatus Hennigimonas equi]
MEVKRKPNREGRGSRGKAEGREGRNGFESHKPKFEGKPSFESHKPKFEGKTARKKAIPAAPSTEVRLNKFIANSGVCSRR